MYRMLLIMIGYSLSIASGFAQTGAIDAAPVKGDHRYPPLPVAASSLGAIECDGYLYVYGGHIGKTHTYSTKDVVGTFHRLKLAGGTKWEELPAGPIAQGMNLTAHQGKVIRIGGMQPRNEKGQPSDNHSLTSCGVFDPKTMKWSELPPLPAGRSSHDVVTVGDQIVVVGGWEMRGRGQESKWHNETLILDLSKKTPQWVAIPQPFQRRALTAAAVGTKVYVLCGLDEEGTAQKRVDVLDLATQKWTTGPDVPGEKIGFSPAATVAKGRLIISTMDQQVHRLNEAGNRWEKVASSKTGRMVHRLVPVSNGVLLIGGAGKGGNFAELELVPMLEAGAAISTASPAN